MTTTRRGLIFANLVDFDTQYGHRNDVAGYAANLERFDARLGDAAAAARRRAICWSSPPITATIRRRRAPITRASTCPSVLTGPAVRPASTSARAQTFADLGQTLAEVFGVGPLAHGTSFLARYSSEPRTSVLPFSGSPVRS